MFGFIESVKTIYRRDEHVNLFPHWYYIVARLDNGHQLALLNRVTLQKVLSHYCTKFRNKLFSNGTRSNKVTRQSCTPLAHQWQSSWSPRHEADQHATSLLTIVINFQSNQIKKKKKFRLFSRPINLIKAYMTLF